MINAISPIDGRYNSKTKELQTYFSEEALIKYRILVEVEYLIELSTAQIISLGRVELEFLKNMVSNFNEVGANRVKEIERITNHDVKAVEYYIKELAGNAVSDSTLEFIHFGLTSQDINNTAMPLMLRDGIRNVLSPIVKDVYAAILTMAKKYREVPILSRTHGQAASPSTLGKEMMVFADRLSKQLIKLEQHVFEGKFGGATGNFNAHKVAYPEVNWTEFSNNFLRRLGLVRQQFTTQIDQYDNFAEVFHIISRINVILMDFAKDIWTYVSMDYFKQKVVASEVGSSAMPHKVNPIDFENAEGNLGIANAMFEFLSRKLPISRLQRDLTDSTVTRNIGVPIGHSLIACKSLIKGISKLELNNTAIQSDLNSAWAVVSEGIQTILRREGFAKPYELLKEFSRGKSSLTKEDFEAFIETLSVGDNVRNELLSITPFNYIGESSEFKVD